MGQGHDISLLLQERGEVASHVLAPLRWVLSATERDTAVKTAPRTQTGRPPMYKVMLLNDDYTPMDFVVQVLKAFFNKSHPEAIDLMLAVHHAGAAICGVYSREVADTKVDEVLTFARLYEHPLQCVMERE